jgi:hypothetical protein
VLPLRLISSRVIPGWTKRTHTRQRLSVNSLGDEAFFFNLFCSPSADVMLLMNRENCLLNLLRSAHMRGSCSCR